jgi:hypothetical protein
MTATDRVRFVPGALLASADLRDEVAAQARAREMHVRAVHGTWGIALGYAAGIAGPWIIVGPGIAYDCHGHELVSDRTVALAPPEAPGGKERWYDLAVRRLGDDALHGAEALCGRGRRERPRFTWTPVDAPAPGLQVGEAVPVARVRAGAGAVAELSFASRRAARPAAASRVAAGSVALELRVQEALFSTHAIDTSAGGFAATPSYFASLSVAESSQAGPLHQNWLDGPMLSISDRSRDGFTLTVRFGTWDSDYFDESEPPVALDWIGVEPIHGCWPAVALTDALLGAGVPKALLGTVQGTFVAQPALGSVVKHWEEA